MRSLNSQLSFRLAAVFVLLLVGLVLLGLWIRDHVNEAARATQLAKAREHYAVVVAELDRRWGREAFNLKTRIESLEVLENAGQRSEKLLTHLISQGSSVEFPSLRIEKMSGEPVAAYDYSARPDVKIKFKPGQVSVWYQNPADGTLYQVIRQLIWLGKENGNLVLLKPFDHALLTQITYPGTRLSLWWKGHPIASSDGDDGLRAVSAAFNKPDHTASTAVLTWSGPESEQAPKLLIEALGADLIGLSNFALPEVTLFLAMVLGASLAFAGLWLRTSRQANALLAADQRYTATGKIDEHVAHGLRTAQGGPSEVTRQLAAALERQMAATPQRAKTALAVPGDDNPYARPPTNLA